MHFGPYNIWIPVRACNVTQSFLPFEVELYIGAFVLSFGHQITRNPCNVDFAHGLGTKCASMF